MSTEFRGEFVNINRFAGPEYLLESNPTRRCYAIHDVDTLNLTHKEAVDLVVVLLAAIHDWRGEL